MGNVENLIDALVLCVPELDPAPLRASLPASSDRLEVLEWMSDHLMQQELLVYEEWKEYFGDLPALRPLAGIDLSTYDESFIVGELEGADWEEVDPYALPYELPYLEYINSVLAHHGLRLVDLLPFENAYIFCVKDNAEQIQKLGECLKPFGMSINPRNACDQQQVKACIEKLLAT